MKLFVLTAAAVAATAVLTAPAGASGITKHDRQVIAFFQHHPRAAATPAGGRILSRLLPRVVRSLQTAAAPTGTAIPAGVCASCWDSVASCESGDQWGLVTGNGFYWGLQWVPSTWDASAQRHGLPSFKWFASHHTYPTREQQIVAASDMALSNWPVCQRDY